MQQRRPKMDTESSAQAAPGYWPEVEEAPEFTVRRKRLMADKRWSSPVNILLVVIVLTVLPIVVILARHTGAPAAWIAAAKAIHRDDGSFQYQRRAYDRLLGGLLFDGFDEKPCQSRYQSAMYRRNPPRQPSPYFIAKLREHEALQRRCGPGTDSYKKAVEQLRSGKSNVGSPDCKYLVSISYRGLGNRILAAASAFLYAVLTDRVLLIDRSNEMDSLFCEPFPGTTWLLPPDFPLKGYTNFSVETAESYGNMLKNKVLRTDVADVSTTQLPVFAYVHLDHDSGHHDKLFYCDEDQTLLREIQWLVMRTDSYIVPGLFLTTAFQEELDKLFPERDAVFHHLGRYLLHPSNHIWGLVTRYYRSYLAGAQQRVGIQVRVFGGQANSPQLLEQITTCARSAQLLPELLPMGELAVPPTPGAKSKAVLITSLKSWYYESIKTMYWERTAVTGEAVSVHQASHEEYQHFGEKSHDTKAWAEIYLLSLTDELVTSGWSTFGYVAQGLGGLRPWVMYKPANDTVVPDPPCGRDVSMEPCFHAPPFYDCRLKRGADTGAIVPHVRHCHDVSWGLKLVDRT